MAKIKDENPDVAEVLLYNKLGCKHPVVETELRSMSVGSGQPGVIGSHMEQYWVEVCQDKGCRKELKSVLSPEWRKLLDTIAPINFPTK
jgi:hypothetical protein